MAAKTQLSTIAIPGVRYSFIAKEEAVVIVRYEFESILTSYEFESNLIPYAFETILAFYEFENV